MTEDDVQHLRRAIELAASAREHGNHPFGAVLVDGAGEVIAEAENTVVTDPDVTAHAETNLVRTAWGLATPEVLGSSTLYASTEPCVMCAGAIHWAGIPRVVYGLPAPALATMAAGLPEEPELELRAADVLTSGGRRVEVVGPLLLEEATTVHEGFWHREPRAEPGSAH
jgi:tRNA(Arg) A34 adenosine deaminase TadA